jgi:heme A synthase
MTDDRKSGIAFLIGSLGGIVTMAIHPTGGGVMTPAQAEALALASEIAHTLAMVSFLIMFLGAVGLTRRLARSDSPTAPDRLAIAAIIVYAFAAVALMLATSVSGFIVPDLIRHMIRDTANGPQWRLMIDAIFTFNQAFARIYSVAASLAILLWSASALRHGGLNRGIATYGSIVAIVITILIAVGHLRLNVHGMAVVVFAQALWFVLAGIEMMRAERPPTLDSHGIS